MAALRDEDPDDHDLTDGPRAQVVGDVRFDAALHARRLADIRRFEEGFDCRSG
jgi:hypothetical protein